MALTNREQPQVLILEDNENWQEILSEIVNEMGFMPIITHNLKTARTILQNQKIDVVVLDLYLKEAESVPAQGQHLLADIAKLHEESKNKPLVIVVSGSPQVPAVMKTVADYITMGIVVAFLSKDHTFDENEMKLKLLNVQQNNISSFVYRHLGDRMMDTSLLAMLAISLGTTFFTNVGASAGTIIGKYLGRETKTVLSKIFGEKVAGPEDLMEDHLEAIALKQMSTITPSEKAALETETENSLREIMKSDYLNVSDLDDFYIGLNIHRENGMLPPQNQAYLQVTGEQKHRANYLADWAYRHSKMGDLLFLIRKEKPFLFEVVH